MSPAREIITGDDDCALAERWSVSVDTIRRVGLAARDFMQETRQTVRIISGWRSRNEQRQLSRQGRPTAPDDISTHRSCPATGVDISLGLLPSTFLKVTWGFHAVRRGLRWGGGGKLDSDGIPVDWQHVDTGPRRK